MLVGTLEEGRSRQESQAEGLRQRWADKGGAGEQGGRERGCCGVEKAKDAGDLE